MPEDYIETRELRLIGPDGSHCATFVALENNEVILRLGDPSGGGGIFIGVDASGQSAIHLRTPTNYSTLSIATNPNNNSAHIIIGNAENEPLLMLSADQETGFIAVNGDRKNGRIAMAITENDGPSIEVTQKDGLKRTIF